jgi:hypothetical protein
VELSGLLAEARQENAALSHQVGQLKKELGELRERPKLVVRDSGDVRKIRALKGLVGELRDEVERLAGLLPRDMVWADEVTQALEPVPVLEPVDRSVLDGKTIGAVGWLGETVNGPCRIVWHDGDSVDVDLQALARDADVLVVLTRTISHAAMWWLKEASIDMDKPIYFVRERNVDRILDIVAEKEKARE